MTSRRSFLKLAGVTALGLTVPTRWAAAQYPTLPLGRGYRPPRSPVLPPDAWPAGPDVRLGRGCLGWGASILSRPNPQGQLLGYVYPDEVVRIVREVVGLGMAYHTHVWFELETGYVYAPYLFPSYNLPQTPLDTVPADKVIWGEIVTPYVDGLQKPESTAKVIYRLYYSVVLQVMEVLPGADGQPWYRVALETGVVMYVPAKTLRVIPAEELTALSPDVDPAEKRVEVYLTKQAISAFEGKNEVFRARISSGANYFGEDGKTILNGTPIGQQYIWQKRISRHMQGGTVDAGYDVPGVGWVIYFASNGAAIHSTYWHNDFGIPKSHGCLNCKPEDAKWLFRWTAPHVPYEPGNISTGTWENRGTMVDLQAAA